MNIFQTLALELLKLQNYTLFSSKLNGDFGFEYMKDYSGLMAKPPKSGPNAGKIKNPKQGYFDIRIITGTRYKGGVTHKNLFEDLIKNSTLEKCLNVWRGENPITLGITDDEKEVLAVLTLLMFEQEINWGSEEWQRSSNFAPLQRTPCRKRPRDMIMGFTRQAFELGIDNVKFWMKIRPGTVCFSNPNDRLQSDYGNYPAEYKRYFTELETMDGTEALTTDEFRRLFREKAKEAPNNPAYKG
jgi:hypothetical protein